MNWHWKSRKSAYLVCLAGFLLAVILYGCGSAEAPVRKQQKFGATYMTMNNPYFLDMNTQIEEIVEANGDILIYRDPAQDQEKQNEQILDMLEEGITGLFLNPVNWETVRPALIACKEAGVPVFVIDTNVYDDEYAAFSILSDNYDAGVQCAMDMMKKKASARIIIIDSPGTKSIDDRVKGFLDTIEKEENIKVLEGTQPTPVTQEAEMAVAESWASKYDEITAVFGGGGPIAIASMRGLEAAGVKCSPDGGTYIYGVDGSQDEYACILDGDYTGTARQQPDELARIATEDVYTVLGGGEIGHDWLTYVDVIYVDKENVNDYAE